MKNKKRHRVACESFLVDKSNRREAIVLYSFCSSVDWAENGLSIASWDYKKGHVCQAADLKEAYLQLQKTRVGGARPVGIGDIICFNETPWLITGRGFVRIPEILWKRVTRSD